jgi:hypothetical protein
MNINEMPFSVINAGMAGCCTGIALSFPGTPMCNYQYYSLEFYLRQTYFVLTALTTYSAINTG